MRRIELKSLGVLGVVVVSMASLTGRAAAGEKKTIDMPADDRILINHYLGQGVVGKPVPSEPIGDPMKYVQFGEDATYSVRMTSGDEKGKLVDHGIKHVRRAQRSTWEVFNKTDVLVFSLDKDGNLAFLSHAEPAEGLNGIYSPPPPLLVKGMEPGSTRKVDFDVKMVYINEPSRIKHKGKLSLTLSYLGTFEINTPSGKHEGLLIKSAYKGKIGPAKVDDTQYRFVVKNVGIVAMVENKDISAFLVYRKHLKVGKLLVKRK